MSKRASRSTCVPLFLIALFVVPVTLLSPSPVGASTAGAVVLEEVVTDPQADHDGSGSVTSSDEYVVLYNPGPEARNVTGWRLVMDDSTPSEQVLEGTIAAGARRVLYNPTGVLNNDVHLLLYADDVLVDEAALGVDGLPDGNADDLLDEAVHLAGPWTGSKGPATNGAGLASLWVERVGVGLPRLDVGPFAASWLPGGTARFDLVLQLAPGIDDDVVLVARGSEHPLVRADGMYRAVNVTLGAPETALVLRAGGDRVDTWPDGRPLIFPVDATPPQVVNEAAVVNATRHLHWLPTVHDPESGARILEVDALDGSDAAAPLALCAWPSEAGPATCPLPNDTRALRMLAENGAGMRRNVEFEVRLDSDLPRMPDTFTFETAVPPVFSWSGAGEPLAALVVERADDVGGDWNRTRVALPPDARTFTDAEWLPGTPRAYRLVATDRAGHTNQTPWVALPPEAVPVQANVSGLEDAGRALAHGAAVDLVVRFDRGMHRLPELVLAGEAPTPFRISVGGLAEPDRRSAHYLVAPTDALPATAQARWRLVGGEGDDGAPAMRDLGVVRWDLEAPVVDVAGPPGAWVSGVRQTLVFTVRDRGDPQPRLEVLAESPDRVEQNGTRATVFLHGAGDHEVSVRAWDAEGNQRTFVHRVGLDARPPVLALHTEPDEWAADAPLVLRVTDDASGVDAESVNVTVRTAEGHPAARSEWVGDELHLFPVNGSWAGPFEVLARASDDAGNTAAGLLGTRLPGDRFEVRVLVNGTRTDGGVQADNDTVAAPAVQGAGEDVAGAGAFEGPQVGGAVTSWSDLTKDPLPPVATGQADDDGDVVAPLVSALVGAGAVGLGTAVVRRRGGARRTNDEGKADGGTPDRRTSYEETPDGGTPDRGTSYGETPDGETPDRGTADEETPDRGTSDGETPDGETPGEEEVKIET